MRKRIELDKYIEKHAFLESQKEIAEKFNVTRPVVGRIMKKKGIVIPKSVSNEFRTRKLRGRTSYTQEQDDFIKANYLTMPIKRIAVEINGSFTGVMNRLNHFGLSIPKELRVERKSKGLFRKGLVPHNKGKKRSEFLTPEQIKKAEETQWKPGNIPQNALKDWEESTIYHKATDRHYRRIKVPGVRRLVYKHVWLWETHNKRKVPNGHNIVFKNNDTMDLCIENLECISNVDLMKRNSMYNYPPKIVDIIKIKGAIIRQINNHQNKNK